MSLVQESRLFFVLFFTVKRIFNCIGHGPSTPQTYLHHISERHSFCVDFYSYYSFILPSSRCVHIQVNIERDHDLQQYFSH